MYYLIVGTDKTGSLEQRMAARAEHLERLQKLRDDARLLTAGPCPNIDNEDPGAAGFSGSAIIAEFDSLESAQAWAEQDPYVLTGVWEQVMVKPFKKVF